MTPQRESFRSKPATKRCASAWTRPGGEVKVSVLRIHGPYSVDIIRPGNLFALSPQSPVSRVTAPSVSEPVTSSTVSKQLQVSTTVSHLNKDKDVSTMTGLSTQQRRSRSSGSFVPGLRRESDSSLQECLIVRRLHCHTQKLTADGHAAA